MDGDWLGRLGVLGEGLAFVFLAPEIMGPRRLRKAETFLEDWLPKISSFVSFDEDHQGSWTRYVVLSLLGPAPWIGILLISLLLPFPFTLGALGLLGWTIVGFWLGLWNPKPTYLLHAILVFPWLVGIIVINWVFRLVASRFLAVLAGERRLRIIVFWVGAALFAMGIGAQFAATF